MFRQGPVPILVHGMLDYLVGVLLIAGPFLIGFSDDTATASAAAAGVLVLDYVLAIAILVSPFLLGFTGDDTATLYLIALAVVQLMQTIATRFLNPKGQRAPRGGD